MKLPNNLPSRTSPYQHMSKYITSSHSSGAHWIVLGFTSFCFGVAAFIAQFSQGFYQATVAALLSLMSGGGFLICVYLLYQGLGYGASEEANFARAMTFLYEQQPSDIALETILSRAEISSSVSPIRNLIPLLAIPLIVSAIDKNTTMPVLAWLEIAFLLLVLLFPIAIDTYTSHIDSTIRHAVMEYKFQKQMTYQKIIREQDVLLNALLLHDANDKPVFIWKQK